MYVWNFLTIGGAFWIVNNYENPKLNSQGSTYYTLHYHTLLSKIGIYTVGWEWGLRCNILGWGDSGLSLL